MSYLPGPRPIWLLLALPVLLAAGCQTLRPAPHGADNTTTYCAPPQVFTTDTLVAVAAGAAPAPRPPLDTAALPSLSTRSWQLARAYDLEPALHQLAQRPAGQAPALADYLAFVRQRQTVVLAVTRATGAALRVAGELECERQRAEQSAVALQALTTKRTNHFTVGSLLMGAASGTISAAVANKETNLVLTLITAGFSAGLGTGALLVSPQLPYPLPRNLLAPVWNRSPRPALYPPGLWAVLNEERASRVRPALPAPLARLRQRWAQYDQLTSGKPAQQTQQQALYFGAGGNYHVADLQTRAKMLTLLETDVRLVAQDLQKLGEELAALMP